jgi:hypothetical protein
MTTFLMTIGLTIGIASIAFAQNKHKMPQTQVIATIIDKRIKKNQNTTFGCFQKAAIILFLL